MSLRILTAVWHSPHRPDPLAMELPLGRANAGDIAAAPDSRVHDANIAARAQIAIDGRFMVLGWLVLCMFLWFVVVLC